MLVQYTKGRNKRRKGVMIAFTADFDRDCYHVGVALCHDQDKFNPETGRNIAYNRTLHNIVHSRKLHVPMSMRDDMKQFLARCDKYFKNMRRPSYLDGV